MTLNLLPQLPTPGCFLAKTVFVSPVMFMRTGSGLCSRKAFLEHLAVSHSFDKCVDSLSVCFKHWVKLWRYNRVNRSIPAAKSSRSTRKDRLKAQQMRISAQNVSTIYKTGKQQGFTVYHKYPEIYCVPQIMEKNVKNFLRIHTHTHCCCYFVAKSCLLLLHGL